MSYSIVVLLSFFARFGLDQFCVRYIGNELAEQRYVAARDLVNVVVLIVLGFSFVISALLYFLYDALISDHLFRDDCSYESTNLLSWCQLNLWVSVITACIRTGNLVFFNS